MKKSVAMIGGGAWGTAVSTLLAENGFEVKLWCHENEVVYDIKKNKKNSRYLPDFELDQNIKPTNDIAEALENVEWVFEAIPVKFLRSILEKAKPYVNSDQTWVFLSKGIEQKSLLFPPDILDEVFDVKVKKAAMGGPNYSKDLAAKRYTASTVACKDENLGEELQKMLANSYFHPYRSSDLIGVEIGGALKNVLALNIGIVKGAGFASNTGAFLLTRGLAEVVSLAGHFGAQNDTIYGLSGLGDLILSSFGKVSRNQIVGEMIGQGKKLDNILEETGFIPEGVNTVQSINQLIKKINLDLPICKGTYEIIFENRSMEDFIKELMSRPLSKESTI